MTPGCTEGYNLPNRGQVLIHWGLNCRCWAYRRSCLFPFPNHLPLSSQYPTHIVASGHGQNKAWVMPCLVLRLKAYLGPSPAESQHLISEAITESVTPSTDTIMIDEKLNSLQASDRKTKLYNNFARVLCSRKLLSRKLWKLHAGGTTRHWLHASSSTLSTEGKEKRF